MVKKPVQDTPGKEARRKAVSEAQAVSQALHERFQMAAKRKLMSALSLPAPSLQRKKLRKGHQCKGEVE